MNKILITGGAGFVRNSLALGLSKGVGSNKIKGAQVAIKMLGLLYTS